VEHATLRADRSSPYLRIENVTKRFGDFVAVNDVSRTVRRGEIFCLLGGLGFGEDHFAAACWPL